MIGHFGMGNTTCGPAHSLKSPLFRRNFSVMRRALAQAHALVGGMEPCHYGENTRNPVARAAFARARKLRSALG